jgi:hypothetical protein
MHEPLPETALNSSDGHGSHSFPTGLNPALHEQDADPATEFDPGPQARHSVAACTEYWPALQLLHAPLPFAFLYWPGGQATQLLLTSWYPGVHSQPVLPFTETAFEPHAEHDVAPEVEKVLPIQGEQLVPLPELSLNSQDGHGPHVAPSSLKPGAQWHPEKSTMDTVFAAHGIHDEAAENENWFAVHVIQLVSLPELALNLPVGQAEHNGPDVSYPALQTQAEDLSVDWALSPHVMQVFEVAPLTLEYCPAAQCVQDVLPILDLNVPGPHSTQLLFTKPKPASQEHSTSPGAKFMFAGQLKQAPLEVAPWIIETEPPGQEVQEELLIVLLYVPASHWTQMPEFNVKPGLQAQSIAPATEVVFNVHDKHTAFDVAPVVVEKVPASHCAHASLLRDAVL